MSKRVYISISLLSAGIIAFQLTLMQLLSISQWNHFAYMVISVAMLGFGASGTLLSIFRKTLIKHIDFWLPVFMSLSSLFMGVVMLFPERVLTGFDSYLLFIDKSQIYSLTGSYMMFFLPFFFGAAAIGLVYSHYVKNIGPLYFSDLIGSGLGAIVTLLLLNLFSPQVLPFITAIAPLLAAFLVLKYNRSSLKYIPVFITSVIIVYGLLSDTKVPMSQYKSLSRTMLLPDATIEDEVSGPHGYLQLVSSPAIRYAPGLSLTYTGVVPVRKALFNNGNWFGPVVESGSGEVHFLDYSTNALPFIISSPESVLIPDAGTGLYVSYALWNNAKSVTAIETNRAAIEMVSKNTGFPFDKIRVINRHPRSYLMSDTSGYDLIILPVIESFGGNSGINALQEQYLFTIEAFRDMWNRLTPNGMIAATVWMDHPPRNTLRMLSTLAETAQHFISTGYQKHILAIRGWGTVTYLLTKAEVTEKDITKVVDFCRSRFFDPLLLPGISAQQRGVYNSLQDESFFNMVDRVVSVEREYLYHDYDFQIKPATDSKPYFSQFIRIGRVNSLRSVFGDTALPFLEVGYLIVILTFLQIFVAAVVLIIIPLIPAGFKGAGKSYSLIHFGGIGVGFMFVEIVLIQLFTLYFGNVIYAAASVLCAMLIFCGTGAFYSGKIVNKENSLSFVIIATAAIIALMALMLPFVLRSTIHFSIPAKVFVCILVMGPLSFLMGIPFPAGIRVLANTNESLVPWAWGINGCLSVISTVCATIVAVEAGFQVVMLTGAAAYLLTLFVNFRFTGFGRVA